MHADASEQGEMPTLMQGMSVPKQLGLESPDLINERRHQSGEMYVLIQASLQQKQEKTQAFQD